MKEIYLFSAVFTGCGIFSLGLGLREYVRMRRLMRHGIKTRAVAHVHIDDDDNVSLTATFTDENGDSYRICSKGGTTAWKSLDGQEIEILYMKGQPKLARMIADLELRTELAVYWFGFLYIAIGLGALVLHFFGINIITE